MLPAHVHRLLAVLGIMVLLDEGVVGVELAGGEVLVVSLPRNALKVLILLVRIDI